MPHKKYALSLPILLVFTFVFAGCFGQPATVQPTALPSPYFKMTADSPAYMPHPAGCTGMWVAGNVTDFSGATLDYGIVRLSGALGIEDTFAGLSPQFGVGGYEIQLSALPENHYGTLLQIYDFSGETELIISELAGFRTYEDCSRNLIIINWEQVK